MRRAIYCARTPVLAGIGLTLAACAAAPAPSGYGPADYYAYGGPPIYGTFDFDYGGGGGPRSGGGERPRGPLLPRGGCVGHAGRPRSSPLRRRGRPGRRPGPLWRA